MSNATQCQEFQASQRKFSLTEAHQRLAAWLQSESILTRFMRVRHTELAQPVALAYQQYSCYLNGF